MYTTAVLLALTPVKYALGVKVKISSVPASKGIALPVLVTATAPLLACAAVVPMPRNTSTLPELMTRYWLPPNVLEMACTGVGAPELAVNVTVLPEGQKGALTLMLSPKEEVAEQQVG